MTHQLIANMLGVRREGVTAAAGHLQAEGLIRYQRGHTTVLGRPRLEARVCQCYAVVKREYDRLLPPPGLAGAPLQRLWMWIHALASSTFRWSTTNP